MRSLAIAAGLLGFAAIASGADPVAFRSQPFHFELEYTMRGQTVSHHEAEDQTFTFRFPDAHYAPGTYQMAADPASQIWVVDGNAVESAKRQADWEAKGDQKKYNDALKRLLANVPSELVDCRAVAAKMVENMVDYDLVTVNGINMYQKRMYTDRYYVAQQLSNIVIARDASLKAGDREPRFLCNPAGSCTTLQLKYNPLPTSEAPYQGQNVLAYTGRECDGFRLPDGSHMPDDSSGSLCKQLHEARQCGLFYTQKAPADRMADPHSWGLADVLRDLRNRAIRAYESGQHLDSGPARPASATPSWDLTPVTSGAMQPAR